jgi:hypothetical protein
MRVSKRRQHSANRSNSVDDDERSMDEALGRAAALE